MSVEVVNSDVATTRFTLVRVIKIRKKENRDDSKEELAAIRF